MVRLLLLWRSYQLRRGVLLLPVFMPDFYWMVSTFRVLICLRNRRPLILSNMKPYSCSLSSNMPLTIFWMLPLEIGLSVRVSRRRPPSILMPLLRRLRCSSKSMSARPVCRSYVGPRCPRLTTLPC